MYNIYFSLELLRVIMWFHFVQISLYKAWRADTQYSTKYTLIVQ
jgi:hypothetical protein